MENAESGIQKWNQNWNGDWSKLGDTDTSKG